MMRSAAPGRWLNPDHAVLLEEQGDGAYTITMTIGAPVTDVPFAVAQRLFPELFGLPPPPVLAPPPPPPAETPPPWAVVTPRSDEEEQA